MDTRATLKIPRSLFREVHCYAQRDRTTVNRIARRLLLHYLERQTRAEENDSPLLDPQENTGPAVRKAVAEQKLSPQGEGNTGSGQVLTQLHLGRYNQSKPWEF